jgi:GNAT superfamily N-acetyltransferase
MNNPTGVIRPLHENECGLLLDFIKGIAEYEHLLHQVVATEETLFQSIFVQKNAQVVVMWEQQVAVGFALYFYNFSTFIGRKGLYLEDLYVLPEYRKKGYGKQLFLHLVSIAKRENCGRMEWSVLDWNQDAIGFYHSLGAKAMDGWTVFRLTEDALKGL